MTVVYFVYFDWSKISPRWLIANGKDERARAVVEKAAKRNGVKLSTQAFQPPAGNKEEELDLPVYSLKDMFRSSQLKITIVFFICWPKSSSNNIYSNDGRVGLPRI